MLKFQVKQSFRIGQRAVGRFVQYNVTKFFAHFQFQLNEFHGGSAVFDGVVTSARVLNFTIEEYVRHDGQLGLDATDTRQVENEARIDDVWMHQLDR